MKRRAPIDDDLRSRAQHYADVRWWTDDVKVVGYAIHRPEWDMWRPGRGHLDTRSRIYSVQILYRDGSKHTRFICATKTFAYQCTGCASRHSAHKLTMGV